jgi:hypothetical protein
VTAAHSDHERVRALIRRRQQAVEDQLRSAVDNNTRLAVVKAPPGSGKTHTLLKTASHALKRRRRVAIGTQTGGQADDICRRIARDYTDISATRFVASDARPEPLGSNIGFARSTDELPNRQCIVVATVAKWGLVELHHPFDILLVDEAWQMKWADFMLCDQVAGRFVLIGDPGQIPPVVPVDSSRWETSARPPHFPTPEVILGDDELRATALALELPASRRLPFDSVDLVCGFYDFSFDAWAGPGERAVLCAPATKRGIDKALDLLISGSAVGVTIPTPDSGPPTEKDDELARVAADLVTRLLRRRARIRDDDGERDISPRRIGLVATHRTMNTALDLALPTTLRGQVLVDTPERWQGLELDVLIAVHPLSGVTRPSEFDLETGRLCVMASRHRGGLIVLSRDHIGETLRSLIPSASQPVGRPDVAGRGHKIHLEFWNRLESDGRLVST